MLERLKQSKSSRMRPDLEAAIEYLPGLASLALWCNFADTEEDVVAYTDGVTIYAGVGYENFETKQRRFICLHEILHIALCHPSRAEELEKRELSNFNQQFLNIAADAIINGSLEKLTGLEVSSDAWTLIKIWQCLEKSDEVNLSPEEMTKFRYSFAEQQLRKIGNLTRDEFVSVGRWSCEDLYFFLKSRCQVQSNLLAILDESDSKDALNGDLRSDKAKAFQELKTGKPIRTGGDSPQQKLDWQQRLSLLRGTVPQLLERLTSEIPRVETPWEQILLSLVQTAFQEETRKNYSRPSRRWLAMERDYWFSAGINLPFTPDSVKKRGSRLAVALDTSGSIDRELLTRFLAEISALCAFNQQNLVLIISDSTVHKIVEIDWRTAGEELARIKYTGGGGTDFRPAIKAAAQFEPDALVYLTDLFGETGNEPDFPVIWATHGVAGTASWGNCVRLK